VSKYWIRLDGEYVAEGDSLAELNAEWQRKRLSFKGHARFMTYQTGAGEKSVEWIDGKPYEPKTDFPLDRRPIRRQNKRRKRG